jgi:hypothetical protein
MAESPEIRCQGSQMAAIDAKPKFGGLDRL